MANDHAAQRSVCAKYDAKFIATDDKLKLGIGRGFNPNQFPVNGARHPVAGGTCGWYIWSGSVLSQDAEFFIPMHMYHLSDICPEAIKYLGMEPGWRFMFAPDHEDVWWDASLLHV